MAEFFDGRKGYSFAIVDGPFPQGLHEQAVLKEFFGRYPDPPIYLQRITKVATDEFWSEEFQKAIAFELPGYGELYVSNLPPELMDTRVRKIPGWVTPKDIFYPLGCDEQLGETNYWFRVALPCAISLDGCESYQMKYQYVQAADKKEACTFAINMLPQNWDLDDAAMAMRCPDPYDNDRLGYLWEKITEKYLIIPTMTHEPLERTGLKINATMIKYSSLQAIASLWPDVQMTFEFAYDLNFYHLRRSHINGGLINFKRDFIKYVIGTMLGAKWVVLIPEGQDHYYVKYISDMFKPMSAGIFDMDAKKCRGESSSLNLSSRPEDTEILLSVLEENEEYVQEVENR